MTKNNSIDGFFIPRRQKAANDSRPGLDSLGAKNGGRQTSPQTQLLRPRPAAPLRPGAADYFNSGAPITAVPALPLEEEVPRRGQKNKKKAFRLHKPSSKTIKRVLLVILALLFIGAGYFAYKFFVNSGKVFKGNVFNAIFSEAKPLKTDTNGRSNILLFGTSEDDPGHPGPELSDSIMVLSVDQKKKDAFMVSIPRDLNVEYGRSCISGTKGKINVVYECAKSSQNNEEAGQAALRQKTGSVLGLDVQYSVHVNYTALKQAVDAVGGITVVIESDNPRGIYERYVKLPNGPAHLNGEAALALARARNAEGGYGLSRSNFDREQYQQKILVALKEKATSAGTLANPVAVNSLIDTLGDNVRTNFDADEIKTLVKLAQDVPSDKIKRLDLNKEDNMLFDGDGQPTVGDYNYNEIRAFIRAYASGDTALLEGALVDVFNASGVAGAGQAKATVVTDAGLEVNRVDVAPASAGVTPLAIYDLSKGKKPATLKKLKTLFGIQSASTTLPSGVTSTADFVIIVGNGTTKNTQ
ncbi:MAG TPA: LCP family protein [Candidatus Saccharimonadales bacterium]